MGERNIMKSYFIKKLIVGLFILILSVPVITYTSAVEISNFTEDDCVCPGLGMELKYAHAQWNEMFTARFEKSGATAHSVNATLQHETWANYITAEIAKNNFNTKFELYKKDDYNRIKNQSYTDEDIVITEDIFTEDTISFIYGDYSIPNYWGADYPPRYKGFRDIIYRDICIISITGDYFESSSDILNAFSTLESCIKAVLDSKITGEPEVKVLKGRITGFSSGTKTIPIKHMQLVLEDGDNIMETKTDANGDYNFTLNDNTPGKNYVFKIKFAYENNGKTYFKLYYQDENKPVVLSYMLPINSESDLTHNIDLYQELPKYLGGDWAKTYASMYIHFTEALEFYTQLLKIDVNYQLPLEIYTFVPEQTGTLYWYDIPGKSYITIDAEKSIHESVYRPMNREYHEFSHYIMHALYQKWPAPSPDLPVNIEERNHDGYLNPSTSDSYVEGFAIFMSAVMLATYQEIGTIPMTTPDPNSLGILGLINYNYNTEWKELETNVKVFGDSGKAEERAIARVLWDLIDSEDDYCDKTPEEMYQEYLEELPARQRLYDRMKIEFEEYERENGETDSNVTIPPFKIHTLDDFKNLQWDDDNVSLEILGGVWDVIKHFHNNFTSVYKELISKYPQQKNEIDKVFIKSGFYADTNPGNGKYDSLDFFRDENNNKDYDEGEYYIDCPIDGYHYNTGNVIGQATNYNRQWRQSVQEIPGYFIKVDNNVPFYLIKVTFPNKFYLDYVVRSWNDNGLVSIPVPPEGYHALVTVIPEGVNLKEPLNFSSDVFHLQYENSLDQGYYLTHDFQITGQIPSYPSMPSDNDDNDNGSDGTPGFEFILLICGLALILFIIRRR